MERSEILEQLKSVPRKPGVYIYKDAESRVLYVGKALSLRNRMRSYFQKNLNPQPKLKALVDRTADFDVYVVDNEVEALVLECTLIKKHRPPYNVLYRDDKSYPFIAVSLGDRYPRVYVTREPHRKGTRYYGPYTNGLAVKETFEAIRKIFPFRTCKKTEAGRSTGSPCLNFHIKRCFGPCIEAVEVEDYREMVSQICRFLEGKADEVIARLERDMTAAAARLEFERAARLRDRVEAARFVRQRQKVVSNSTEDMDVIGFAVEEKAACANISMIRDGKLLGSENFILSTGVNGEDILSSFVKQYYNDANAIPELIVFSTEMEDAGLIEEWLTSLRGASVRVKRAQRGVKRELAKLADTNAEHFLELYSTRRNQEAKAGERAAIGLMEALGLATPPRKIECFDISTHHGDSSVGSMVVFVDGRPEKKDYRHFRVRLDDGEANDFAMMREIVGRRLSAPGEGERPDLIVVDGGKPQLTAAMMAAAQAGVADLPIVALAKREEEIFIPGHDEPINLPERSDSLNLVKRLRDEAHRFAVSYHRMLRSAAMSGSDLDRIAGVGEMRKRRLVGHFGSPGRIAEATLEELLAVPGLPSDVAAKVYRHYHDGR